MRRALVAIVLVSSLGGVARAERPARMKDGVYFRFGLGATVVRNLVSVDPSDRMALEAVDFGTGAAFDIELGGVVDEGLAMGLYIAGDILTDVSLSGPARNQLETAEGLALVSLGINLTYYPFRDGPWFVCGGIGIGLTSKDVFVGDEASETGGLAAFSGAGWEFRVSNRWSLGVAARIHVTEGNDTSASDSLDDVEIQTSHHGVGFSAMATSSYNLGF